MKTGKKLLSLALALLLTFTTLSVGLVMFSNAADKEYATGDIIEFGSYPQSQITDEELVAALNSKVTDEDWISYEYYDALEKSDYMKYCDVDYKGEKYRGVYFEKYRPRYIRVESTEQNSYQDDNGYYINNTYWFKYEPLEWRVLDAEQGLILCENIIDSQQYYYSTTETREIDGEKIYPNNYEYSDIRTFLNEDFYNSAFNVEEKELINYTFLDNTSPYDSEYDSAPTLDNVFLLSYDEATNSDYGFSSEEDAEDINRRAYSTDYAKCQGVEIYSDYQTESGEYTSDWWLRSPGQNAYMGYGACLIYDDGHAKDTYLYFTMNGVRPAITLHIHSYDEGTVVNATCTEQGYTLYTCSCGDTYKTVIPALGHKDANKDGICDTCKTVFDEALNNKYLVSKVTINAPSGKTVDYRNKVKLTATTTNVPNGYYVQIFEGTKAVGEKGAATATYTSGELKAGTTYTVKIVDAKGNVVSSDAQNKTVKVDVNAGFFKKIIAFFKGLFGTLPTINL